MSKYYSLKIQSLEIITTVAFSRQVLLNTLVSIAPFTEFQMY